MTVGGTVVPSVTTAVTQPLPVLHSITSQLARLPSLGRPLKAWPLRAIRCRLSCTGANLSSFSQRRRRRSFSSVTPLSTARASQRSCCVLTCFCGKSGDNYPGKARQLPLILAGMVKHVCLHTSNHHIYPSSRSLHGSGSSAVASAEPGKEKRTLYFP